MKSFLLVLLIALGANSVTWSQSADSVQPLSPPKWARSRNVDMKHIALDLRFDWKKKQAYGTATITLSPFKSTDRITLDAGLLTINSITMKGAPLKFEYDGGDKNDGLAIALGKKYNVSEDLTLTIDYHTNWKNESDPNNIWGSVGKGIRFFEPTSTEPKKRRQIWSVGEPESNRYWFPGYDAPNDLRTTEFTATVDKSLTVISNGRLESAKENGDGTKTFKWRMDTPYANHLTAFAVGEYTDAPQKQDVTSLHNFAYSYELEATKASVVRLPDMVKYYSELTGQKYPYQDYAQVFVPDFAGLMGNSGMSLITENMVDDFGTHDDFYYLWDITEGEALAHQWFGSYLSAQDWSHQWLSNSFSRYFSGLYNEHKNGTDEFLMYQLAIDHSIYLGDWSAGIKQPVVTRNYESAEIYTASNYVYFHGASVLHMLRKHLGDEQWNKAIKQYVKLNANKLVTTEDFRKAVEDASGQPMDWFFDQWVYKMGHPVFQVTKSYDEGKKELTIQVKQTQSLDSASAYPQAELFQGKIQIEIDGRVEDAWLDAKRENVLAFSVSQNPGFVNFDYQSTWIKELQFEKSNDELLHQLQNSTDVLARLDAVILLAAVAKDDKTATEMKNRIHDAFRAVILSNSWWRLRANTLSQFQGVLVTQPAKPTKFDKATLQMLLTTIDKDRSWVRASAISFLSRTRDPKYTDLYIGALKDPSDRVVNSAAVALGRTKSPRAYGELIKLKSRPSWKNQSLISSLNGLRELGDPKGVDLALKSLVDSNEPHWTLATSVWDHRLAAAETLVALKAADKGYPLILAQFTKALEEGDINDIFYNTQQVAALGDPRGKEVFAKLKDRYKNDEMAMIAVGNYEAQFEAALKNN